MGKNKMTRLAVISALVLVVAVLGIFALSGLSWKTPEVTLPDATASGDPSAGGDSWQDLGDGTVIVGVTRQTVQSVIATLSRPTNYHKIIQVMTYWDGGSGASTVEFWVRGGYTYEKINNTSSGKTKYIISGNNKVYIWYEGDKNYFESGAGDFTADDDLMIPTYEDILDLPADDITDAGYVDLNGTACIYVQASGDTLGYTERYWVSVNTGLLVSAQMLSGDTIVYDMTTVGSELAVPSDDLFLLPDGSSAIEAA